MGHGIAGIYANGHSTKKLAAFLHFKGSRLDIVNQNGEILTSGLLKNVSISSRLGNTPRVFRFGDGAFFETKDNDGTDAMLRQLRPRSRLNAHLFESKWRFALASVVIAIFVGWIGIRYGIPTMAEKIAFSIPNSTVEYIGQGALANLDQNLEPSKLSADEQQRLRERFDPFIRQAHSAGIIRIEFRDAEKSLGANALALPSGVVVFTDQIVQLAASDEELIGVLAHEIGHVDHRHGIRGVLQASAMGLIFSALTGDAASASVLIAGIPLVLTQTGYSRTFEFEADHYSASLLNANGLNPTAMFDLLDRMERQACGEKGCSEVMPDWAAYILTHPPTEKRRAAVVEALSQQ